MVDIKVINGDAYQGLDTLENDSVDCVFTSPNPPFYSSQGIGSEDTIEKYLNNILKIFEKVYRVAKGSCFVHMSDYHNNLGDLPMVPEYFAMGMKNLGWILRSKTTWYRLDEPMQEDTTRFKRDAEPIFFFTKYNSRYFFNPLYCKTSVFSFKYTSGFPVELIEVFIRSGCPAGGTVLDIFCGTGSTGVAAKRNKMNFIGIELDSRKVSRSLEILAE